MINKEARSERMTYLIKFVRAWIDNPSWSKTFLRCNRKSLNGIANPFRGAIKEFGSIIDASGLKPHLNKRAELRLAHTHVAS